MSEPSQSSPNLYSPPALSPSRVEGCFRHGALLAVRNGATLPLVCPLTARPVAEGEEAAWATQVRIGWTPPWVFAMAIFAVAPTFVLMAILRKSAVFSCYFSPRVRKQARNKKLGALPCLLAGGILFGAALVRNGDSVLFLPGLTGLMMMVLAPIVFLLATPLKANDYRDGMFFIPGCSPRFLKTMPVLPEVEAVKAA